MRHISCRAGECLPPPLSILWERLRAATGEPQHVCNDSGVCPCDGFYGASSPYALSFSASRCFSGSVMMPNRFQLPSKRDFPCGRHVVPVSRTCHRWIRARRGHGSAQRGNRGGNTEQPEVYEDNPRYTIEQNPEQGEILRSEIQKGDTAGKILGDWMDANELADLLAAAKPVYALTKVRFGQPFTIVRDPQTRRSGVSSTKSIRKDTSSLRRRTTVLPPGLKRSITRLHWRSSKVGSKARSPKP